MLVANFSKTRELVCRGDDLQKYAYCSTPSIFKMLVLNLAGTDAPVSTHDLLLDTSISRQVYVKVLVTELVELIVSFGFSMLRMSFYIR